MVEERADQYRKWDGLPMFRGTRQPALLIQELEDYFQIKAEVQTSKGFLKVKLPTIDDWRLQVAIEAFIVGWARGYGTGRQEHLK